MNKSNKEKLDVYGIVTERVIEQLEKGTVPWLKPWAAAGVLPQNYLSRKAYRGVNVMLLGMSGYACPYWVTFKQALGLGGCVMKGEKGTPVVFWNWLKSEKEKKADGTAKLIPFLKYYTVFNLAQCEGIKWDAPEGKAAGFDPIAEAEAVSAAYCANGPRLVHGCPLAAYSPTVDKVQMPDRDSFTSPDGYYSTLFHELTHSTGSAKRLNRPGIVDFDKFGSTQYAKEELVAEMGAAYLCGMSGIAPRIEQSAAYIANWLKALKDDRKLVVMAAAQAQKAADWVLAAGAQAVADEGEVAA